MTTVLKINQNDLSVQFFNDLYEKLGNSAQVELRIKTSTQPAGLLSESQFWQIISLLDWQQTTDEAILKPAVTALSQMPVANIYIFKDLLSEKLFALDTKRHAQVYVEKYGDDYLSVDDFLYTRCAVVAEGKDFYEKVLKNPTDFPIETAFESLLYLANVAYEQKTGKPFNYTPSHNYETKSNLVAWQ
jgi:hypothetical protein